MLNEKSYLTMLRRVGVSVSYLKEEDVFCLYYPGPIVSTTVSARGTNSSGSIGQQCFKFEYYDMVFAINKLRDEIWVNRSKFYKEKKENAVNGHFLSSSSFTRGQMLCDILSNMFGYRCNDCLVIVFDRYCLSKTSLDKCRTLRKKSGGKRKIFLKERGEGNRC
jgi:hypothetical protein